jgi:hypothetical protein
VLDYLEGNLSSVMFVDAAFNLKHNGGAAFDKFPQWMKYNSQRSMSENKPPNVLEQQLNLKANATVKELIEYTKQYGGDDCYRVVSYCEQETIFKNRKKHEREQTAQPTTAPAFAAA